MFAALIAALGLAIGLALQGALANFAGDVLILTFHPFRIGDLVEIGGSTGVVEDIQLVNTVLISSVNFAVRPFARIEHYWDVYFDVTEQVKTRFDAEGISFPYPQQDVHVLQAGSDS